MTPTTAQLQPFDPGLAKIATLLTSLRTALLPLDVPGCDGTRCNLPAFHDRSTGVRRHLRDLSCCRADPPPTPSP